MRALFIGGTGNISTSVSKLAVERGVTLYLLNRHKTRDSIPGCESVCCDIDDADGVSRFLEDQTFDCAVNWIGFSPQDVERDIALFKGKTGQYRECNVF